MERKIVITGDGSHTLAIPEMNVTYHSIHGAVQESRHVFIDAGLRNLLKQFSNEQIKILEVGFGTGLNALLTAIEVEKSATSIYYAALEPFPISIEEANSLNYCEQLGRKDLQGDFIKLHECEWNKGLVFTENILVHKSNYSLQKFESSTPFDLIYYDAFAPVAQPDLWTKEIFEKLFRMLSHNGILVTYCSKGDVRRAMLAAGFQVKKLKGPPGKREILRATKISP
jgi:tRNA U34 5-methylaminomethyl-2-thiouridine-forming methyltransferase MnmC